MVDFLWQNIFKLTDKEESLRNCLKKNILFRDLSSRELNIVEKSVHQRHYRSGETIFRQGEAGIGMYIIQKGSVSIFVEELLSNKDEIKRTTVAELGKSDFLGELALAEDGGRRNATAVAQEETVLIGFFKPDLVSLCERNPGAGVKILNRLAEILGHRLRETTVKVSELKKELRNPKANTPRPINDEHTPKTHTS